MTSWNCAKTDANCPDMVDMMDSLARSRARAAAHLAVLMAIAAADCPPEKEQPCHDAPEKCGACTVEWVNAYLAGKGEL